MIQNQIKKLVYNPKNIFPDMTTLIWEGDLFHDVNLISLQSFGKEEIFH